VLFDLSPSAVPVPIGSPVTSHLTCPHRQSPYHLTCPHRQSPSRRQHGRQLSVVSGGIAGRGITGDRLDLEARQRGTDQIAHAIGDQSPEFSDSDFPERTTDLSLPLGVPFSGRAFLWAPTTGRARYACLFDGGTVEPRRCWPIPGLVASTWSRVSELSPSRESGYCGPNCNGRQRPYPGSKRHQIRRGKMVRAELVTGRV
jgi:hypothetical protein